ncbi:hypothetical protein CYMTET_16820 [Cymbomonas tetramitiformis]|uniref:Uncharacterized protein n=1 Tax=Cymbomonas tetramitiformis TaxID=36881 RepID=A0AAE0GBF1_9CHLO|nr:hypothetical protein CYMTET_16820 [Cymbomonas tetramitiformis]
MENYDKELFFVIIDFRFLYVSAGVQKPGQSQEAIRLQDAVRNSSTPHTPPVLPPPDPAPDDDDTVLAARQHYQDQIKLVNDVRKESMHRTWGKALRMFVLGDKNKRVEAVPKDINKLGKLVVALKTEFQSAGLDVSSFDFANPSRVIEAVNELSGIGRRALLDLIKGYVPPGVWQSHQEEHAALRYPARVDPRPLLATEHRSVRENRALDWRPTEATRKQQLFDRLDPEFYRAVLDQYPMPSDLVAVDFKMLSNLVTRVFVNWQQQQADLGGEGGTAGSAAALATGDESEHNPALKAILDKITVLEHFIRGGCKGPLTPTMKKTALGPHGGLN